MNDRQTPAPSTSSTHSTSSTSSTQSIGRLRNMVQVVTAVLGRPTLWWTALRVVRRVVPRRWWARPPFLPIPSRAYLRFRKEAYYGDPRAPFRAADVLKYLMWVRAWTS